MWKDSSRNYGVKKSKEMNIKAKLIELMMNNKWKFQDIRILLQVS